MTTTSATDTSTASLFSQSAGSATGGSSSTGNAKNAAEIQNQFLTMLVAQLQNQDPLNPLDNTEITNQLAQMSTVSGIEKLNLTLSSLVNSVGTAQAMQAASLIGQTVLVPGANLTLASGKAYGGATLESAADQVTVSIMDTSGNVVQTLSLGAQKAGDVVFSWDGKTSTDTTAADGKYSFKVAATSGSNKVTATPLQFGTVSALVKTSDGYKLDLGALGQYDFDDVQQVY